MFDLTGRCVGCDQWHILDDLGMCDTCAAKFDRDLIHQRAWDYSATVFGCDPKDYESLRQLVIDNYRAAYELLAPPEKKGRKQRKRRRR
jgi:hypothetical protein